MDYALVQTADKNLIYYGVYNTEVEIQDGSDVLCSVRKNYFESGKHQRNRTTFTVAGEVYKCAYAIEDGRALKWKKLVGSKMTERVMPSPEGYYVETLDTDRRPFKKSYFDLHHKWLMSEYFSLADKNNPIWTLTPSTDGEKPVIMRKSGRGTIDVLYPFEHVLDRELTEKLNIITCEPQIYCRTSSGSFYFCTPAQSKERSAAMKKLLDNEKNTLSDEEDDEVVTPSFNVNIGTADSTDSETEIAAETTQAAKAEPTDIDDLIENDTETDTPDIHEAKTTEETTDTHAAENTVVPTEKLAEAEPAAIEDIAPSASDLSENAPWQSAEELCSASADCPFERCDKLIIESGGVKYYYFGETDGETRHGFGRTIMADGRSAYEGSYKGDKRDGFGVYYYRSGKLCYAGNWVQNRRNGLGAAFSSSDGSIYVGKWSDNESIGIGASFSSDGELVYAGRTENGLREGAGLTRTPDGSFFVGKYKNGEFLGIGTLFDKDGNMLYSGGYTAGKRSGDGIAYNQDGTVLYRGQWKNDRYHGEGTLFLADGGTLSGQFRAGAAHGKCTLTDRNGRVIYVGSYIGGTYNGTGRLYNENGGYAEGRFVDGEPTGVFNEYDGQKHLVYCGEWSDMRRSGKGIEYQNGEKLYEGQFENSAYHGEGKLYENGSLVFAGSFVAGIKNGFGIEFIGDDIHYQGQWKNGLYDGCGILYSDGVPKYAGCFENGKRSGRINEISGRSVIRKCIYENNELVYMCEFTHGGELRYYGSVKDGRRSGMGCSFGNSCEKEFEGIFRNGEPEKPMQVFYRELAELPKCEELENTEYELFRHAPEYIIEKKIGAGIFTGRLKGGVPAGHGTMLYFDHRYTGQFSDGKAKGIGVIYTRDGNEIRGVFSDTPTPDCRTYAFADNTYYLVTEANG